MLMVRENIVWGEGESIQRRRELQGGNFPRVCAGNAEAGWMPKMMDMPHGMVSGTNLSS